MATRSEAAVLADDHRFSVEGLLGEGASGAVYRAYDRVRGGVVAVKVLLHVDAAALLRFKSEFRSLTGLTHRNLLQLHELLRSGEQWLLTMELIEGSNFLEYVCGPDRSEELPPELSPSTYSETGDFSAASEQPLQPAAPAPARPRRRAGHVDGARLRRALAQLCDGLRALHRAGRLHRDLKPANVLVCTENARVVICDFGLATQLGTQSQSVRGVDAHDVRRAQHEIVGTLAYMSPEQAMGLALSEASDWYAVGAMLYHALAGQPPFDPALPLRHALAGKLLEKPIHPGDVDPELPHDLFDLAELALELLQPLPGARPTGRTVSDRLASRTSAANSNSVPVVPTLASFGLVGRDREQMALAAALSRTRNLGAGLIFIAGSSGFGKSALLEAFLDTSARSGCVVLSGRCYEREQLPFKAFDPLMDALSSYLIQLDDAAVSELVPREFGALVRLFPVFARLPLVRDGAHSSVATTDTFELRREAFRALRELCRRIALVKPLVLSIDDLQWADLDSAPIFVELLRGPDAPAMLVVGAYRSEERSRSDLLELLEGDELRTKTGVTREIIELERLDDVQGHTLALGLLPPSEERESAATLIVREAGGNPLFIRELAAHVVEVGQAAPQNITLEDVIERRLDALTLDQRRVIELVAVAGHPESLRVIQETAALRAGLIGSLSALAAQHLVRTTTSGSDVRVEVFHDRIRDAVYRRLSEAERREAHKRLAETITGTTRDPASLFRHWRGAGEFSRAAEAACQAARAAEASLAYLRAATLYGHALELLPSGDSRRRELTEQRGRATMLAGHGVEAAELFLEALHGADVEHAAELRGLAITQLLRAGRLVRAAQELNRTKRSIGIDLPRSEYDALLMLLWRRSLLALGRDEPRRLRSEPLTAAQSARLSLLWAVGAALSCVDLLRGSVVQADLVRAARQARDPYQLACALSLSTTTLAAEGKDPGRVDRLFDRALVMAGRSAGTHALSVVKGTLGVSRMLQGRFADAVRLTRESQQLLRQGTNVGLAWDRVTVLFFDLQASASLGHVHELIERVPEARRDAEARGDLLASTLFRSFRCSWAYLGLDEPERAREQALAAEAEWQQPGYSLQHYYVTHALVETALYAAEGLEQAWERIEREWKPGMFVRKIEHARIELHWLRARVLLARADANADPALRRAAAREARALSRERVPWARGLAYLVEAASCRYREPERSRGLLAAASQACESVDMKLIAAAARVASVDGLASEEARTTLAAANAAMAELGVKRPESFVRLLVPGFSSTAVSRSGDTTL